ncbi:winged helix-turn-helix domain-containing protein [Halopiger djelfimassiliensis]|uniref:winged helix-turn-helix domain-containing protein n=1 Tax=Halopiger djelfimassiliensis TaxID=1293047 RepID=UPI000677F31C|nr:winged helix-turn-helix domain-containing protein [Halopiger djelfimassiliensis]
MTQQEQTDDRTAFERPADPFKALGNGTRLEILRALYERGRQSPTGGGSLSYSELRDAVGIEDKGNFNYHLRQLDGRFVDRAPNGGEDDGNGYRLTFAGFEIAKVIDVDAWRSHESLGPIALEAGADGTETADTDTGTGEKPLTATYEDSVVEIRRDDVSLYAHAVRPAGAVDRGMELDALLDVVSTLWRHTIDRILRGICPYCHATVERSFADEDAGYWTHSFTATCPECGSLGGSHVGAVALTHPAVVSLFWEHDIDVTERRFWTVPFVDDEAVTVVDETPRRLRLDVELEGERLECFVDDTVRIVETHRVDADG